uniref:EF-1-gamma C-terminal domain-containing protein n=1 Tax=Chlamydomonas euryale TaxID=1486919 RepID=A0A7R9VA34_9CHLO|mmetsp:Transcript_28566/g.84557  ORF Transcript_28566/g.84557 Transcript_28566/m.84557 type:complete len:177 (+) Transcript_28566:32-562(+)
MCTLRSFSDSDDEDGGKPFDLPRWRKFYAWNRNKQADLTEFLWRRFDPRTNSMFVVTYAAQDAIFAGYQGDNAMHGMACRLEEHLDGQMDLFGIIHTYLDHETGAYKVLGLMITDGTDVPPQLRRMPDFDAFHFNKVADTRNPTIRKFVGSLLAGDGPTAALGVICSREISLQRKH